MSLRHHEIAEAGHRFLNPSAKRSRRAHLAYQRRFLGWGVFVTRAQRDA